MNSKKVLGIALLLVILFVAVVMLVGYFSNDELTGRQKTVPAVSNENVIIEK